MKLGMFTGCLPGWDLDHIAAWASTAGYETLEVAVWPSDRASEGSHLHVADFTSDQVDDTKASLEKHGLEISALAYFENNLHPDPARRQEVRGHLKKAIDSAQKLGVPHVGTWIGRDWTASISDNIQEAERILPELVEYAGERGVKLLVENCAVEGWHPDGYPANLAYSPELWEWMFSLGFYLNWDPSHLVWLGIDPVGTIAPYIDRIAHAQAKDVEIDTAARQRYGFYGRVDKGDTPWDMGWWRYRMPGLGEIDWKRTVDRLYELGFTGTLAVEHEDPVWGGDDERVTQGLRIAHRTLRPLIVA
ncbi:sugar phosphate isomerase/epimerase [Streptomyces sp. BE147]|uniref:sugar phosphate isomerase/epimerase family protein n=1 Tax=unclassified Streptomyces TaxID=2593676 RepID=UPI002E7991AC|nr:sugar phosphate isomerase/epimerase [Streptomyces sp. BE147]MEE1736680.1 sugar phosphate isomerase/epimerase [Streptomyces sp. BE147]